MKKIALTIAIFLGIGISAIAQEGGLFGKGPNRGIDNDYYDRNNGLLALPQSHGEIDDSSAPLGTGIAVFMGLGAAYLVAKRRKEE